MKRYEVVLTLSADKDLGEIFDYISGFLHEPNAAAKLVSHMYKAMHSLSEMPLRYALSKDTFLAKQGFRTVSVGKHLIFYVVDERKDKVIIHRVLYGRRNYSEIFHSEPEH